MSSGDGFDSPDKHACYFCNVGFYQDQYGATQCKQCPNGLTTIAKGSTSLDDCGSKSNHIIKLRRHSVVFSAKIVLKYDVIQ